MKPRTVPIMVAGTVCLGSMFLWTPSIGAQARPDRLVPIAELEIDPGQLEAYKSALREEIEASIRIEPGVLTLYAVAVKTSQIRSGFSRCTRALPHIRRTFNPHTS